MPEGPSLIKWCTMIKQFLGRKTTRISGSSKTVDKLKWSGATLEDARVYGKQLFLHLAHDRKTSTDSDSDDLNKEESMWLRCHFLMWGSVRVNEFNCKPSKTNTFPEPRLVFYFSKDEFLVFYGGSFKEMNHPPDDNSKSDILSKDFDRCKAADHILEDHPISYILLDQSKFCGLGNIIKNEVLYSTGTHPMQLGCRLSRAKAAVIVDTVVTFSERWLAWKMEGKPSRKFGDWTEIYKKAICPKDHATTKSMFGPTGMERITYWCPTCQPMENPDGSSADGAGTSDLVPNTSKECYVEGKSQNITSQGHNVTESLVDIKHEDELEFKMDFPMMSESPSLVHESERSLKSEQVIPDLPHYLDIMDDGSPSMLPFDMLETKQNSLRTERGGNKTPLSFCREDQARPCSPSVKKIKLGAGASCTFHLKKEEEPVVPLLYQSGSPGTINSLNVADQQQDDFTRISVSVSTIRELMRIHARVHVKKLTLDEDCTSL
ncbi:endonuclease 8-like 2 [Lytechinus pictus]|uniref:endonuclease 8-like 2 n=1 Tax=Lytechinus pictus TaxID=7653 RepID=UPI0030B9DE56